MWHCNGLRGLVKTILGNLEDVAPMTFNSSSYGSVKMFVILIISNKGSHTTQVVVMIKKLIISLYCVFSFFIQTSLLLKYFTNYNYFSFIIWQDFFWKLHDCIFINVSKIHEIPEHLSHEEKNGMVVNVRMSSLE